MELCGLYVSDLLFKLCMYEAVSENLQTWEGLGISLKKPPKYLIFMPKSVFLHFQGKDSFLLGLGSFISPGFPQGGDPPSTCLLKSAMENPVVNFFHLVRSIRLLKYLPKL